MAVQHKNIRIVNVYAPNIRAPKTFSQIVIDLKGEIDNNTITVVDFRSSRQKINKKTLDLSYTVVLYRPNRPSRHRTFHPILARYTFFSSLHATISKRGCILSQKTSLSKCKRLKTYQVTFLTTVV